MRVGLTGGIGCGKSTVIARFREAGWQTIESDALARQLLAEDPEVRAAVTGRWGERCLGPSGSIDRAAVAGIVFKDAEELKWLESQLHPRVRAGWQAQVAARPADNHLVEIPLLFEKSLESAFDFTVCVHAPDTVVESRMQSRGFEKDEIRRRRSHQLPVEEKMRRADFVISNAGNHDFLNQQINHLLERLLDHPLDQRRV